MSEKDIWNDLAGAAISPTVCRASGLESYHPMEITTQQRYNVELHILKIDNVEIPGKYVLTLKDGWSLDAIKHVNYREGQTLIFEKGDEAGSFLVATPPNGVTMDVNGEFSLKRWEIHMEQTSPGKTELLDRLTWEPIIAGSENPDKQFVTSWRWKND